MFEAVVFACQNCFLRLRGIIGVIRPGLLFDQWRRWYRISPFKRLVRLAIISNVQIAVVDHERVSREFVTQVMMYSVNRDVLVFDNAEKLIRCLDAGKWIHLVLCEMQMPGKSGFGLLKVLKSRYPRIIFVAVSADSDDEPPASELGADAFLAKPFDLKDLFDIVQHFVVETAET